MYKGSLLKLIKEYISCANYVCSLLKELNTTSESILRAIKIKQIPKQGYLDKPIQMQMLPFLIREERIPDTNPPVAAESSGDTEQNSCTAPAGMFHSGKHFL
jgi:hypothetical protein